MQVWCADGFDEGTEAQVAGAAQQAFAGADNECQGFGREGVMAQAGPVELVEDELFDGFGGQPRDSKTDGKHDAEQFSSLMDSDRDCSKGGWPMSTKLWERGKSSHSRRSLRRQSGGMRWASSMMGTSILPARWTLKACCTSRRSQ